MRMILAAVIALLFSKLVYVSFGEYIPVLAAESSVALFRPLMSLILRLPLISYRNQRSLVSYLFYPFFQRTHRETLN